MRLFTSEEIKWQEEPDQYEIKKNEIHIWSTSLPQEYFFNESVLSFLSDEEIKRYDKFHAKIDKNNFAIRRAVLRLLLSKYINCNPSEIKFSKNDYGKPYLSPNTSGILFNLSYSKELILYGFAIGSDLGIDVECLTSNADHQLISQKVFSPEELVIYNSFDLNNRKEIFYRLWTRKEAFIKATGLGFSFDGINELDSSKDEIVVPDAKQGSEKLWKVFSFVPSPNYQVALAFEKKEINMKFYSCSVLDLLKV